MKNRHVDKNHLEREVASRMNTIMIGILATLEKSVFGRLWGQQKCDEKGYIIEELTEEEEQWLAEWENVRDEILDKGNNQIKLMKQDLRKYMIKEFEAFFKMRGQSNDER